MKKKDNKKFLSNLYLLKVCYRKLINVLEVFFGGDLIIEDEGLNEFYLKICWMIEKALKVKGFEELKKEYKRPFENLLSAIDDTDYLEGEWELVTRREMKEFCGKIEQCFIRAGKIVTPEIKKFLSLPENKLFFDTLDKYLTVFKKYKHRYERKWFENVVRQMHETGILKQDWGEEYPPHIKKILSKFPLRCKGLRFYPVTGNAVYRKTKTNFKPNSNEYKLLKALMEQPNKRFTYRKLCEIVFGKQKWKPKVKNTGVKRNISFIVRNIKRKLNIIGKKQENEDLFFSGNGYGITCD